MSKRMQEVSEDMMVGVTPHQNDQTIITQYNPHNVADQIRQSGNNKNCSTVIKSVVLEDDNGKDYSPSASSCKNLYLPLPRVNLAVRLLMKRATIDNRSHNRNNSLPISTRKKSSPPKEVEAESVVVHVKDLVGIKNKLDEIFTLTGDLKSDVQYKSDGLILKKLSPQEKGSPSEEDELIPIGSGITLIPIDKYRQVNWKSYTIATRTLLMATFSRRVLATHSLTGKRSPAFQNKPAKMCLDPKIVSDIIWEITSKFKIKESLVRSIITTKCADECKMYKSRTQKKRTLTI